MIVTRTPLRFSLIGGGSDLEAYWRDYGPSKFISMTLAESIYVTYTKRRYYGGKAKDAYGNNIRIAYTQTENVDKLYDIKHDLVREALKVAYGVNNHIIPEAFEITTVGDVPGAGAGLGTSSSLTVGLLKALIPDPLMESDEMLVNLASEVEIVRLKRDMGVQDQMAAVFGGLRQYEVRAVMEGVQMSSQSMDASDCTVGSTLARSLIAFRLPHNRSSHESCAANHNTLEVMKDNMKDRREWLKKTVELVSPAWLALASGDYEELGKCMGEAWKFKQLSHGYVDKDVQNWYDLGMTHGAMAGKVSGSMSGGAGHLFFLCYPDAQEDVRRALAPDLAEMEVTYYPYGSRRQEVLPW